MLTQTYQMDTPTGRVTRQLTPQLAKAMNLELIETAFFAEVRGIQWRPVETERFSLVANETIKVGTPVNRNDADYWISQFARLGAIGEGERVGRVKVEVAR